MNAEPRASHVRFWTTPAVCTPVFSAICGLAWTAAVARHTSASPLKDSLDIKISSV
jgi:hypothetical protein